MTTLTDAIGRIHYPYPTLHVSYCPKHARIGVPTGDVRDCPDCLYEEDAECPADREPWPCRTHRAVIVHPESSKGREASR